MFSPHISGPTWRGPAQLFNSAFVSFYPLTLLWPHCFFLLFEHPSLISTPEALCLFSPQTGNFLSQIFVQPIPSFPSCYLQRELSWYPTHHYPWALYPPLFFYLFGIMYTDLLVYFLSISPLERKHFEGVPLSCSQLYHNENNAVLIAVPVVRIMPGT